MESLDGLFPILADGGESRRSFRLSFGVDRNARTFDFMKYFMITL
jgi:hypothetical protein